jgi:hypothetical protein
VKVKEMIERLIQLEKRVGNVEVVITDGHQSVGYKGDFEIETWIDDDNQSVIDIGIGGCEEQ